MIRGHINRFYTEVTLGKLKNNIFDLKTTSNSYMKISVFFFLFSLSFNDLQNINLPTRMSYLKLIILRIKVPLARFK